jgi:ankyrin repeat protein
VHARSTREHGSTLLHYVSANGVEGYRQKTPANIVEVAKLLLHAGADVNAESEAYGGGSTTLGLTATSCHPEAAGVQIPLMQLLLDHGARVEPVGRQGAIRACLANGRGPAAEFLAEHGANVGLEEAAGVGRLDIVERFIDSDGMLRPPATTDQLEDGFAWACEYGRTAVAEYLLRTGAVKADEKLRMNHGQTGLHWAAYGGHADTVGMLLTRRAPVHARDDSFDNTPLEWALYAWGNRETLQRDGYYEVVRLLVQAGATLDPQRWVGEDPERRRSIRLIASDPRMREALGRALSEDRNEMA